MLKYLRLKGQGFSPVLPCFCPAFLVLCRASRWAKRLCLGEGAAARSPGRWRVELGLQPLELPPPPSGEECGDCRRCPVREDCPLAEPEEERGEEGEEEGDRGYEDEGYGDYEDGGYGDEGYESYRDGGWGGGD